MKDYNEPPSWEFKMLTGNTRYPFHWLTLMKAVMNDYYFDVGHPIKMENLDTFMHKIYYCWLMTMREIHGEEE